MLSIKNHPYIQTLMHSQDYTDTHTQTYTHHISAWIQPGSQARIEKRD